MIATALCMAFIFTIPAVIAIPVIVGYEIYKERKQTKRRKAYDETIGQPFDKI